MVSFSTGGSSEEVLVALFLKEDSTAYIYMITAINMDICKYCMSFLQCDADGETHKHCILHHKLAYTFRILFLCKCLGTSI